MHLYATCLLVTCIFSFHYVVAKKLLLLGASVFSLISWRGIVGGLLILLFFKKTISFRAIWSFRRNLLIAGFFGFFLNQYLFMRGLKNTTPFSTAIISNTIPVFSLFFSYLFGLEKSSMKKTAAILGSFVLVVLLILFPNGWDRNSLFRFHWSEQESIGNLLIFLNVTSFCFALTLVKKTLNDKLGPAVVSGCMLLLGGLLMGAMSHFSEGVNLSQGLGIWELAWGEWTLMSLVFFEIVLATAVAYYLNFWTLSRLPMSAVTFFIYVQPIITALLNVFMFKQWPSYFACILYAGIVACGCIVLRAGEEFQAPKQDSVHPD